MRVFAALIVGEVLLLGGLWLAWVPLALVVAGVQVCAWALLHDTEGAE